MTGRWKPELDIIGDVHGQVAVLEALLEDLGYHTTPDGRLTHPEDRSLVFIGDLIDRGPKSFEVAELVRRACADGSHLCLLGNHELNIVEWRRGRSAPKHSNRPTIQAIEANRARWNPILDFFETLPLALELEDLRITHAVWHQSCFEALAPTLSRPTPGQELAARWRPFVRLYSPYAHGRLRAGLPEHPHPGQSEPALSVFLKGHETPVLEAFRDNDGRLRHHERARWWQSEDSEVPRDKRLVFGHYWNLPPIPGRHEAHSPPFASGHPKLRDWAFQLHEAVDDSGRSPVPTGLRAVCIDFNGVTNAGARACIGAYRYPEAQVLWQTRPIEVEPGP